MSVSRRAGPPHFGQVVLTNAGVLCQRRSPRGVEIQVVGQLNRQLLFGHGHDAVLRAVDERDRRAPGARRETPQSRILKLVFASPKPCFTAYAVIASIASGTFSPLNGPELINSPVSSLAVNGASTGASSASVEPTKGLITRGIGSPYFLLRELEVTLVVRGHDPITPVP